MTTQYLPANGRQRLNVTKQVSLRASACPGAIALGDANHTLTFGELESRSNQLAHFLRSEGIQKGDVVGLLLDRSVGFAVAALAAMKSGAAYLPMDPEYPRERIDYLLRDSGASLVLTDNASKALVPASMRSSVVDFEFTSFGSYPHTAPEVRIGSEDLAYIIYTSGSTGQPKGVELTHAGLSNLVAWHVRAFSLQSADRSSQVASVGFDAAVWELWPSLCAGASVLVPDGLTRMAPERFRDWIVKEKVTVSFAPTCIAELLLTLAWPAGTALRYLLTGADVLRRYAPEGLPFRLVNNYGPTECTVVATSGFVPAATQSKELPSIGTPIDDAQIYILDRALRPVLQGEEGEICIGGAGLARGYRNNPTLTAERFTTYHGDAGPVRIYRTGDIGRVSERGEIEFRGRADDQVKIRGHRIELQEIALVLNRHPSVRASAVVVIENSRGEQDLAAYVVTQRGDATESDWSSHLSVSLPRYMIPSIFVRVSHLPLTPNGKLDRAALPPPPVTDQRPGGSVPPRGLVQERLERLVSQLLGVKAVSVADNLFHLGGHSLFGAQLISRIRNGFGVELPLRVIFEQPTVELLSHQIEVALAARLRVANTLSASAQA